MTKPTRLSNPFLVQWLILSVGLFVLLAAGMADLYQRYTRTGEREQERLRAMSMVIQVNLEQNLRSINGVLTKLQSDLPAILVGDPLNQHLQVLAEAMPGVRTLNINDISGIIRATSRAELLGKTLSFTDRDYFKSPQQHPSTETLFVSPPFVTAPTGVYTLVVSRMIPGPHGEFAGVIVATLDPTYFFPLIESVRYAPDMFSSLAHGDGVVLMMAPRTRQKLIGVNLAKPGSLFLKHKESGQPVSVISGTALAMGEERMLVQRTVQPLDLNMDKPLEITVSRLNSAIYEAWWHDLWVASAYFFLVAFALASGLAIYQRRMKRLIEADGESREALATKERFLRDITDNLPGMVAYWTNELRCTFTNPRYQDWAGKTAAQMDGMHLQEVLGEASFHDNEPYIRAVLRGDVQEFERTQVNADGSIKDTYVHYIPDRVDTRVRGFYAMVTDVTQLKRAEFLLREHEEQFRLAIETSGDGFLTIDANGRLLEINAAYATLSGYSRDELLTMSIKDLVAPEFREQTTIQKERGLRDGAIRFETAHQTKDGKIWPVEVVATYSPIHDGRFFVFLKDRTEEKKTAELIWHQANFDRLTNLPNRSLLFDRLSKECSLARRGGNCVALLFADLDGFKQVNDQYGHETGDQVLVTVAQRWLACVRETDTVARMGGDEFAIVLGDLNHPDEAAAVAEKLIHVLTLAIPLPDGNSTTVGVSIGISTFPSNAREIDTLVAAADTAMYKSKSRGKNTFSFSAAKPLDNADETAWFLFKTSHLTGIAQADDEHRHLIRLVNRLNQAIVDNRPATECRARIDEIIQHTMAHFAAEQKLMDTYDYPGRKIHVGEHDYLIQEVERITADFHQGSELLMLQTIKDWLLGHVQTADRELGRYLDERGVS